MTDKDRGNCLICRTELLALDDDSNGAHNEICKRCVAEEEYDAGLFPGTTFTRSGERIDPPKLASVEPHRTPILRDVIDGATVMRMQFDAWDGNEEVRALRAALKAAWSLLDAEGRQRFWNDPAVAVIASRAYAHNEEDTEKVVNYLMAYKAQNGYWKNTKANIRDEVNSACEAINCQLNPHSHRLACERILEMQKNDEHYS